MMINCKQATRLMSEELDRPLKWQEKATLSTHNAMCVYCRNYRKHMSFMREAARRYREGLAQQED